MSTIKHAIVMAGTALLLIAGWQNVRFGSLADLFANTSLMSAFERKTDVPLFYFSKKTFRKVSFEIARP